MCNKSFFIFFLNNEKKKIIFKSVSVQMWLQKNSCGPLYSVVICHYLGHHNLLANCLSICISVFQLLKIANSKYVSVISGTDRASAAIQGEGDGAQEEEELHPQQRAEGKAHCKAIFKGFHWPPLQVKRKKSISLAKIFPLLMPALLTPGPPPKPRSEPGATAGEYHQRLWLGAVQKSAGTCLGGSCKRENS